MDVSGAQYGAVKGVDSLEVVDDFKARWVAQAKLDVDPSLVTLWLVESCEAEPAPEEEAKAKELRPRVTLAAAGLTEGCSVLAYVAGTKSSAERLAMSTSTPGAGVLHTFACALLCALLTLCCRLSFASGRLCSARAHR